jgi:putative spermidine/putrescine transport system substrate-binding protein
MRRRRRWPYYLLAVAVFLAGGAAWILWPVPNLTVASWGGDYSRAQTVAMFHPFSDRTGIDVDATIYGGGLKDIRAQVEAGAVEWDVVDLELADAQQACREGLLEPLSDLELPPGANGQRAEADFVPGALGRCWVGSSVYSQVVAYDPGRFTEKPARLADFFDLQRFPGPRMLRDAGPMNNLELALLADGVGITNVYPLLMTRAGVDRAFAKLDSIKPSLVWWRRTNEPIDAIQRGEVAMATALNGRVYDGQMAGKSVAALWDRQLYQMDVFGIPKGSPNRRRARNFIAFATASQALADEARWLPYGPARRSAVALVGPHPERGIRMQPHLPTAPENLPYAFAVNPDWWKLNGADIEKRWRAWRGE